MRTSALVGQPAGVADGASPSIAQALRLGRRQAPAWTDTLLSTTHADIAVRQTHGQGLPVLFLHGLSGSKAVFTRQFGAALGAEYRMIGFDFPGCGRSSPAFAPERTASIEGYADLAVEVLERLGIDEVVVVGWESGGLVGLDLATTYPGLVGLMTVRLPHPMRTWDGSVQGSFGTGLVPSADLEAAIGRLPLALVDGERDPAFAISDGPATAMTWGARQHVIADAGGAPFRERPDAFNAVLASFLGQMAERHRMTMAEPSCTHGA